METKNMLKDRRLELGLSLKEVAAAVGVSEGTVSRWESGDIANMGAGRIKALANVLQVSPLDIIGDDNSKNAEQKQDTGELKTIYFAIAKDMQDQGIDPEDIKSIMEILKKSKDEEK